MIKGVDILQQRITLEDTFYPPTAVLDLTSKISDIKEFLLVGYSMFISIPELSPDFKSIIGGTFQYWVKGYSSTSDTKEKNFHVPISCGWDYTTHGAINEIYKDVEDITFRATVGIDSALTDAMDMRLDSILYYQPLRY